MKTTMKCPRSWLGALCGVLAAAFWEPACRGLDIPGADGSDGVFAPTQNVEIDLGEAPSGTWNGPNSNPGKGVYDPEKWAVVFRFASVNVPANVTVTFKNNASRAPVVWLVAGDVVVSGTVDVSSRDLEGTDGLRLGEPGPGGFRGAGLGDSIAGVVAQDGTGFGPGGGFGDYETSAPGFEPRFGAYGFDDRPAFAGRTYGNDQILPLIGGSGAGSSPLFRRAGGGGGAILIAATGSVMVDGAIRASGYLTQGGLAGSGGGIRIVSEVLGGGGTVDAAGAFAGANRFRGGLGRVRLENRAHTGTLVTIPPVLPVPPDSPVLLWPPADAPSARIVSIGGRDVPADPKAGLVGSPGADLTFEGAGDREVLIETLNVPDSGRVRLRITPLLGYARWLDATLVSRDGARATWRVSTTLGVGMATMLVRADTR
ncbi:MAG: hypothetical protein AB7J34_16730 [Limisphaerales bacterium]